MGIFLLTLLSSVFALANTHILVTQHAGDTGDFTHFLERISKTSYSSAEDFLRDWKSERPVYFSNYVMAYRSRSLQQATPQFPRVIMFNRNADMVLSFNGHGEHRGFQNIEMMRFDHEKDNFEFYELSFNNNRAELSPPNPVKCLECHQGSKRQNVDARPNWEPYNAWLGFYGSIDDSTSLMKSSFLRKNIHDDERDLIVRELESEDAWYADFWSQIQPTHERYSLLAPVERVQQREATINGDLTNRLAALNYRRAARLMTENKDVFEFVKWTLWANSRCGDAFYVSDEVYEWLKQTTPSPEVTDGLLAYTPHVACNPLEGVCKSQSQPQDQPLRLRNSHAINLLFEPFLVSTEDWSMDFKTQGRFAAFERFGLTNDPRPVIKKAFERYFFRDHDFSSLSCEELKEKSMENFGSLEKVMAFRNQRQQQAPPAATQKPLIQRCISCHVDEAGLGGIPEIPFDNPERLKNLLHQGAYKRGTLLSEILYRTGAHAEQIDQMPPRGIPSSEQREGLIRYLQSL
jgi:hypothetical protein